MVTRPPDLSLCPFWARRNIHFRHYLITRVQDDDLLLLDLGIWQWSVATGIGLPCPPSVPRFTHWVVSPISGG
ncbi:hypothetical protein LKK83_23145, partial [Phormidium sp. CCY1219]|nr:hypothetical protein [Phormidium sp. CCY1219]